MSRNCLSKNEELRKGEYLLSNNGEYKAIFQNDGNFVIYGWKPIWASNTCCEDNMRLIMQADCNLVIYKKGGRATWHTNTHRIQDALSPYCRLCLRDDGHLVLERDWEDAWSSANRK